MSGRQRLIITADDFGYSSRRDDGILHCWAQGAVTRATLMVNGVSAQEACSKARKRGMPVGLHLNLTEGCPISPVKDVGSLLVPSVSQDGRPIFAFRGKFGFREALMDGAIDLQQVSVEFRAQLTWFTEETVSVEVRAQLTWFTEETVSVEVRAQLTRFVELHGGTPPLHVDGHQHVHVLPEIASILAREMEAFGIREVRSPHEAGISTCQWLEPDKQTFYQAVSEQATEARHVWDKHGISYPAQFIGNVLMGSNMTVERLEEKLTLRASENCDNTQHQTCTTELMVHPGYCSKLEEAGGCGEGPDDFSTSPDREHEIEVLCSNQTRRLYREKGIELVASVL